MSAVREGIQDIVDHLSEESTWEEALYKIYVKEKISNGMDDVLKGDHLSHEDTIKEIFRFPPPSSPGSCHRRNVTHTRPWGS